VADSQPDASHPRVARDLRAISADGACYSLMVGLGETYVAAFVLALGHPAERAALITTLPMLAGALLQLVSPLAARRLGSYRRWVVACARLQALAYLPLVAAALGAPLGYAGIFATMVAYWGFSLATGPAWNAWVETLVPIGLRARFFARRTRISQVALLASLTVAGIALRGAAGGASALPLFAGLFAGAALARGVSAQCLASQSERPGLPREHEVLPPLAAFGALRGRAADRMLPALLGLTLGTNVAAPFFAPFMLGPVGLSYSEYTLLTAVPFLARIAVLPLLGRLATRVGAGSLLGWAALAVVPLPALWLVSHELAWLLALQVLSGIGWGALEYGTLLAFFEHIDARHRSSVLSAYNVANGFAMAVGSLIGAAIFRSLGGAPIGYVGVLLISAALRLCAVPWLRRPVATRAGGFSRAVGGPQ
jgi:hypothetical protein